MKTFFDGLLAAALNGALQGGSAASNSGANLQTIGISAGATALAGVLGYILSHPATGGPTVNSAVASFVPLPK